MAWKFNPFTGTFDQVGVTTGGGGSGNVKVEHRTLTGGEAAAKEITLAATPTAPTEVAVDIVGGVAQDNGFDFSVSGTTLSWNGLGLDVSLSAGDKLQITYTV